MKKNTREWLAAVVTAVAVAGVITQFVMPTMVYGISMEPAFSEKDYLMVSKQAYIHQRQPERGDVIVFESHLKDEHDKNKNLIKRVIGLPGESVSVHDGKVYINGKELKEDYTKDGVTSGQVDGVIVPEGHVFCMGDNRLHSTDSRDMEVGFVKEDDILGKVFFRVFPFKKVGKIGGFF